MCAKPKRTTYRQYTLYLDPEVPSDKEVMDWLDAHHGKRNSYSALIRRVIEKLIQEDKQAKNGG
jgi:hypothetical protein